VLIPSAWNFVWTTYQR